MPCFNTFEIIVELKKMYDKYRLYDDVFKHINNDESLDVVFDGCTMDKIYIDSLVKDRKKAMEKAIIIADKLKKLGYEVDKINVTWIDADFIRDLIDEIASYQYRLIDCEESIKHHKKLIEKKITAIIEVTKRIEKTTKSKRIKKDLETIRSLLERIMHDLKWM